MSTRITVTSSGGDALLQRAAQEMQAKRLAMAEKKLDRDAVEKAITQLEAEGVVSDGDLGVNPDGVVISNRPGVSPPAPGARSINPPAPTGRTLARNPGGRVTFQPAASSSGGPIIAGAYWKLNYGSSGLDRSITVWTANKQSSQTFSIEGIPKIPSIETNDIAPQLKWVLPLPAGNDKMILVFYSFAFVMYMGYSGGAETDAANWDISRFVYTSKCALVAKNSVSLFDTPSGVLAHIANTHFAPTRWTLKPTVFVDNSYWMGSYWGTRTYTKDWPYFEPAPVDIPVNAILQEGGYIDVDIGGSAHRIYEFNEEFDERGVGFLNLRSLYSRGYGVLVGPQSEALDSYHQRVITSTPGAFAFLKNYDGEFHNEYFNTDIELGSSEMDALAESAYDLDGIKAKYLTGFSPPRSSITLGYSDTTDIPSLERHYRFNMPDGVRTKYVDRDKVLPTRLPGKYKDTPAPIDPGDYYMRPVTTWDWDKPGLCTQELLAMGFTPEQLQPPPPP